ncbi:MAG: nascent polypeptide-associated complex protein [archaeon]
MFGNINPKQMQGMMKKMGIAQTEINARRVIIECGDKKIILDDPSVLKVSMQGNVSYQISGPERIEAAKEEPVEEFSDDDVKMVMEKTHKSRDEVIDFLKKNDGDIALAIIALK